MRKRANGDLVEGNGKFRFDLNGVTDLALAYKKKKKNKQTNK